MTFWSGLNPMEKPGPEKHIFVLTTLENCRKAVALTSSNTHILTVTNKQIIHWILVILGRILNMEGQNENMTKKPSVELLKDERTKRFY